MKRALDLFCKAGGATKGLQRAGYHVTGVDINPQPRYCGDRFIQTDALTVDLDGYDLIWASPPCQQYTSLRRVHGREYPDLIAAIRARLQATSTPYIIENVQGAPLQNAAMLCGTMFDLKVYRHRFFESSHLLLVPWHVPHRDHTPAAGHGISPKGFVSIAGKGGNTATSTAWKAAMGIDWMVLTELAEAIPPAYSEYLARQIGG